MASGLPKLSYDELVTTPSGETIWVRTSKVPLRNRDNEIFGLMGIYEDITERKQAEERLRLAASVFTHASEGIMITAADGTIIDVNDAFSRITSFSRDEALGRNPRILRSGRQEQEFYAALKRDLAEKGHWYGEVWNRRKNGEVYAVMETINVVRDAQGHTRHYVALFSDVAHYDALTGLPLGVLLTDRLQQAIALAQRHARSLAVAYLDLDGFKVINDAHGHAAGDQVLIAAATRIKQSLREGDVLARLGGDEFVAVLSDVANIQVGLPMITRVLTAAAQPAQVGESALQVTASLGITFYPQAQAIDAEQLLRQAHQAMYQAKLVGNGSYQVFDAAQDSSVRGHHKELEQVRRALGLHEFVLYYQPKVNLRTGSVIGAEALIRWHHPERGLLPPVAFLPVVENHPLAVALGEWVIDSALGQMECWRAAGLDIPVSVNIGAHQLQQAEFVPRLCELLAAHPRVGPDDLGLEVLETSALADLAQVARVIDACREIGVWFALDDFGTGYSSLTYLQRLPVRQLKLDQSFVRNMLNEPDDLAILNGVLGLASAFHCEAIAEGVETVEHGEMLLQLGCELAQGYAIAHPMPAADLPGWAATWRPAPAWVDLPALSRDDLPLLVAGTEHRAWVAAVVSHLRGELKTAPPLNQHQCRFGRWLDTDGRARHGAQPPFQVIEALHQQVHALAVALCELRAQGRNLEALAGLEEIHGLRDAVLEQLKTLVLAKRSWLNG